MSRVRIRRARPDERLALEELQRRASIALPDYREQLQANPDAIHFAQEQIDSGEVLVAELLGRVAGFAVLLIADNRAELDGLFVEPDCWRQGIGSALVHAAVHEARRQGLSVVTVVAGPGARAFYERCGFRVEGECETRFGPALAMSR